MRLQEKEGDLTRRESSEADADGCCKRTRSRWIDQSWISWRRCTLSVRRRVMSPLPHVRRPISLSPMIARSPQPFPPLSQVLGSPNRIGGAAAGSRQLWVTSPPSHVSPISRLLHLSLSRSRRTLAARTFSTLYPLLDSTHLLHDCITLQERSSVWRSVRVSLLWNWSVVVP